MLRALIIDDEAHMRDSLTKLLAKNCPQVAVVGEATSVASGKIAIQDLQPDIVMLDIQMGDGTGFDLLNALPSINFRIIFVTAFDQYAIHAIRFSAVDYLLKPVNPELLLQAVVRAEQLIQEHQNIQMQALQENMNNASPQDKKIIIKTTDNIHLLRLYDIISCESDNNYTNIYTTNQEKIMVSKTLKDYDDLLIGYGFYRVHKSYLINLAHIKRFERQDGGYIVLTNEMKVPVASRKREEMLGLLERMAD